MKRYFFIIFLFICLFAYSQNTQEQNPPDRNINHWQGGYLLGSTISIAFLDDKIWIVICKNDPLDEPYDIKYINLADSDAVLEFVQDMSHTKYFLHFFSSNTFLQKCRTYDEALIDLKRAIKYNEDYHKAHDKK